MLMGSMTVAWEAERHDRCLYCAISVMELFLPSRHMQSQLAFTFDDTFTSVATASHRAVTEQGYHGQN